LRVSKQQVSAIILILVAAPIFVYALFGVKIPQITYPAMTQENVVSTSGVPVRFYAIMKFTSTGTFSVGKAIHVQVTVIDSNVSDLLNYIGIVSFTGAFTSPTIYMPNGAPMNGYFNLTQVGNGKYYAEGNLIWYQSINTHVMWLQPMPANGVLYFNEGYWQQTGIDILDVTPATDTLTVNTNYQMEQLTLVLVGFSIIMLQPIIVALTPSAKNRR
jgi:hypothetical protein